MQAEDLTAIIERDPRFQALQQARSRLAWSLVAIVLGCFYAFMLTIAFRPVLLAVPVGAGKVLTFGIAAGIAIILLAIALTGLYVWRANRDFDRLNQQILDDAERVLR